MSLLLAEGFDDIADSTDLLMRAYGQDNLGAGAVDLNSSRGGKCFRGDWAWFGFNLPNRAALVCGFALNAEPFADNRQFQFRDSGVMVFGISVPAFGVLRFWNAANVEIGAPALFSGLNSFIEVKLTAGNPGHVTLKVDGVIVLDLDGNFGAAGNINQIYFENPGFNVLEVDDVYVLDLAGATCNDFLGDVRIISQAPIGDGAHQEMTPSGGGAHYAAVDDATPNEDVDYVSATAADQRETYTFPALPAIGGYGVVRAVQVVGYCKTDIGGTDKLAGMARVGGADSVSSDQYVQAVYQGLAFIFETNPATGQPWTIPEVEAAEFGAKRTV